ncbi:hypothetical protein [Pseudomonas sp. Gutcm_11s]|uniref:hypothetical protein n=1 Tax=Pseudomonas sp. Gutcm_11s TaxID=3026088 RepID=UPI002360082B|nr:hypothetical protein [Pseudomonas sp. Gutcm_11s]MDD0843379.1 hypothetical protein [Pseudomonas sp. Gutcm_11s]
MQIAPLDRLISVTAGPDQYLKAVRLSDLTNASYVVLLGEPGLGKTVAFEHFAKKSALSSEAAYLFSPEDLKAGETYFIDAIDEVPIQEALSIAKALKRTVGARWRVSCRAEDWNSGGKLSKAFGGECAAVESAPVIAQLQPLDEEEAIAVLTAFGHPSPSSTLSTLQTLRSTPFVMTPLGLRFLMSVDRGLLPSITRFELYEAGVAHFAVEHNQAKAESEINPTPHLILDTAGRIFLTLLIAGKHSLRRSGLSSSTILIASEIEINPAELDSALDTALFMKKGEDFLPLHRSIQEFLAARFLARLVTDGLGGMRLHIERALALMVSSDGLPSEGLKPLYAWTACHLANEGALAEATRLVEQEPEALLLHGDAAKLPWSLRALILDRAGQRDPFFKWTADRWGPASSCTTGLLTPELTQQALTLLTTDESVHRLYAVLEALSVGVPIPELADACWYVTLRKGSNLWCREAAVAAWANCAHPSTEDIWRRIDELCAGYESLADTCRIVAKLFCLFPTDQLEAADVARVLACLQLTSSRDGVGKLVPITYALRDIAWHIVAPHLWRPLILETPKQWRISSGIGSMEQRFASALCIAVLSSNVEITVDDFAKMMVATGAIFLSKDSGFSSVGAEWTLARPDQDEIAKALLLIGDQEIAETGSIAFGLKGVGLKPTAELLEWMLTQQELLERLGPEYLGKQAAYWVLERHEDAPSWFLELIATYPDSEAVTAARKSVESHTDEITQLRAHEAAGIEKHLAHMISEWITATSSIEAGENKDALYWGAEVYCGSRPLPWIRGGGTEALLEAFGEQLAHSISHGLASVLLKDQEWEWVNLVRVASASILLENQNDALSSVSLERILEVFFAADRMRDGARRDRLESYCVERLNQSAHDTSSPLRKLASIREVGWTLLLHKLGTHTARSRLHAWAAREAMTTREQLSGITLDSVLNLAWFNLEEEELLPMVNEMVSRHAQETPEEELLNDHSISADQLRWAYFGAHLRPDLYAEAFSKCLDQADSGTIQMHVLEGFPETARKLRAASTLKVASLLLQSMMRRDPQMAEYSGPGWPDTVKVLRSISSSDEPLVETTLLELVQHAQGTRWVETLKHELELYRRDIRASSQRLLTPPELAKVISGKGPINAQDLRALVVIMLEEISSEMQPSPDNPWRLFWDKKVPKPENDCRDVVAGKLRDKLRYFGIFDVQPEAASSGNTRADILVTHGNFAVPIEAKRTSHDHLWYGHSGQLQTYSLAKNTEAQGIYLVFWFGKALSVTTPPTGTTPTSPQILKDALERMLRPELIGTTSVIVLDVSDATVAAKDRKESDFLTAKAAKPPRKRKPSDTEAKAGRQKKGS